jgi:ubiquinone/menaquinone biosynthesis C-methylase UbiE
MGNPQAAHDLKEEVRRFWNAEPCGTRYLEAGDEFANHAHTRYELEPHIPEFAQFAQARGLRVLEVGVGMGADYLEWLKAGAIATGVDLSRTSIEQTRRRCHQAGYTADLQVADAEHLPFPNESFDLVYSYGVMHHSPDTTRCVREAWRVLKPGGQIRLMLYHHPSLTGIMLWFRYGAAKGKSVRQAVYEHLESPGTKTFTRSEVIALMSGFEDVVLRQVFSPGDLLLHQPSQRFRSAGYRIVWKFFPRAVMRRYCGKLGLFLLVSGCKVPGASGSLPQEKSSTSHF